jgi:prevent-host-death family protein
MICDRSQITASPNSSSAPLDRPMIVFSPAGGAKELIWTIIWSIVNAKMAKMRVSVSDAKGRLTELVRRAEAGDEVVLTRRGEAAVSLVPVKAPAGTEARRKLLEAVPKAGAAKAGVGPGAARSQDFLYDADGLPQ